MTNCKCKVYFEKLKCKTIAHAIQTCSFLKRLILVLSPQCMDFIPQCAIEGMQIKEVQYVVNICCKKCKIRNMNGFLSF